MSQHVVVIGAVALGPKAAARFKRMEPGSSVTMIDREELISYGGCGIPYFVSGDISDSRALRSTSFHMVRDEAFFRDTKGVDVLTGVEALEIDRSARVVHARRLNDQTPLRLPYDKLVLAMGSTPRRLGLPGETLGGVRHVANLHDAERIRDAVAKGRVKKAVVVGAGFIGLEMAEALTDMWGVETSVVEIAPQILPRVVGPVLARMALRHLRSKGVRFHLGESVREFTGNEAGRVCGVRTDASRLEADLVIVAAGVIPNAGLARASGLDVSARGGIVVNARLQTSDARIYAGGDCVELRHLITGDPFYLPMGSLANRQGRVIGTNLAGGAAQFEGAQGSFVVKLFDKTVAGSGLTLETARTCGFDALSVLIVQPDRAHFYPTREAMTLELVFERGTRRILGIFGFGSAGDALVGRVDAVAAMLRYRPVIDDLSNLEMAYSPPFASAMDIVNSLGNLADNVLAGRNAVLGPDEFERLWNNGNGERPYFLDCREEADARQLVACAGERWHNIPQGRIRERLDEIPRDRPVVVVCNTGARSYEALVTLKESGLEDVASVQGGLAALGSLGAAP
ncbi:NADH oxidase [Fundidesulfovibrio magnetotacticus]|uniref:NADH oxidase n=1 Tax=Fundidesulfovibrio magnetotacticus TaxID=2730080 RepID=A0A6V8LU42_9BACT|nr:FAD-dependent oxidoreductase [Fundidesulfovibrio magnetotacticus]GFK94470.1 NADH oxidase [Fundidesulfovibrio magnetotacticus]